jgi:hypothetical protein
MPQAEPSARRPHVRRAREASEPPSPMAKGAAQARRQPTPRERRSGRPSVMRRVAPLAQRQPDLQVQEANGRRSRTARGAAQVQQLLRPAEARSAQPLETRQVEPRVPPLNGVDRPVADRVGCPTGAPVAWFWGWVKPPLMLPQLLRRNTHCLGDDAAADAIVSEVVVGEIGLSEF